jgi:hypothetical protein
MEINESNISILQVVCAETLVARHSSTLWWHRILVQLGTIVMQMNTKGLR